MLSRELIWEEVAPQYKGMTKRKEMGLSQNELVTVKSVINIVKHMKKQYLGTVPHCTITSVLKSQDRQTKSLPKRTRYIQPKELKIDQNGRM